MRYQSEFIDSNNNVETERVYEIINATMEIISVCVNFYFIVSSRNPNKARILMKLKYNILTWTINILYRKLFK